MSAERADGIDLASLIGLLYPDATPEDVAAVLDTVGGGGERRTDLPALRRIMLGTDHLARPTRVSIRFDQDDVTVVRVHGLTLAVDRADGAIAKRIIEDGIYEPHLSPAFARLCRPGLHVIDIGANLGYYAFLAAQLVGPNGSVLAIEPNSENCRLLLLSQRLNRADNVELLPVALDRRRGWSYFSTEIGSNGTLRPGGPALADGTGTVVPTFALDTLVDRPVDLIKIDVEGAEDRVFAGAQRILNEDRPVVVSELSPAMLAEVSGRSAEQYLRRFTELDYRIYLANRRTFRLDPVPSAAALLDDWGDAARIEDIVLVPAEAPVPK